MTEDQEPVIEEVVAAESAPELDEQVDTYQPPSKVTINKRKQMAVRVSQNRNFAQKNDIQFIAFFEGAELPYNVSSHCGPELIRTVVAHMAIYFNRDFNEAIEFVRQNYQTQPPTDEPIVSDDATDAGTP